MSDGVFRGSGRPLAVDQYEQWLGRPVTHVLDFVGRGTDWSQIDNPSWWCNQWIDEYRKVVLSVAMLPDFRRTLAAGARGDYDSHWVDFFRTLVDKGCGDWTIRLGWEFNGKFFPWAAGGKEALFVTYWRRIHNIARANGFTGQFDWCPLAGNTGANVEAAYPGDAYVDIVGLDAYDTCNQTSLTGAKRWSNQLTRKYGLAWHHDFATRHGKPMSYPEWGVTLRPKDNLGGGDNPFYIERMWEWISTRGALAYACYFDVDASDGAHRLSPPTQFPKSSTTMKAG